MESETSLVIAQLSSPAPGQSVTIGQVLAGSGWVVSDVDIDEVSLFLDRLLLCQGRKTGTQPELTARFPRWQNTGFEFTTSIPVGTKTADDPRLVLQVRAGGRMQVLKEVPIIVDPPGKRSGGTARRIAVDSLGPTRRMSDGAAMPIRDALARMGWAPAFDILIDDSFQIRDLNRALAETLSSLRTQAYANWRSHLADGAENATSDADFFLVLRPGDRLGANALLQLALETALHRDADFVYADERCWDAGCQSSQPRFKPDWSPQLLLSTNYIGRAWCARTRLRERAGLSEAVCRQTSDYDRVLRLTEAAENIRHIPVLLLAQGNATSDAPAQERTALQQAIKRRALSAELIDGAARATYRVQYQVPKNNLISVIIPTCGANDLVRRAIATLRKNTAYRPIEIICVDSTPADAIALKVWLRQNVDLVVPYDGEFNWSRANNLAAAVARGRFLLFLNDDIEVIDKHWLHGLVEHAQQPDIAIAGACLLYPNGTIQHAGMFLDGRVGRHAFRHQPADATGPFGLAAVQREVIAVTGACMLMRQEVFTELGGFDERHRIINNDLDFCLRAQRMKLRVIYTPYARLLHHECASRSNLGEVFDESAFKHDWQNLMQKGDPYFHPALSCRDDDYSPEMEPVETVDCGRPLLARQHVHEILAIKLDHLGDFILALPALRRLRHIFPHARLSVLAAPATESLVRLEPAIDRFIAFARAPELSGQPWNELSAGDRPALRLALAPYHFDIAIDLRQHGESRDVLKLTGATLLAGFDHQAQFPWLDIALEWEGDQPLQRKRTHASDRLLHLVEAVGTACAEPDRGSAAAPAVDPIRLRQLLGPNLSPLLLDRPLICVHPGAGSSMKLWPAESYAALIDLLVAESGVSIVLIGLERERAILSDIAGRVRDPAWVHMLAGRISLEDMPLLLGACRMLIGNDSFPKHLADRLGIPTIGIHASHVDPREWAATGPLALTIRRNVTCGPCYIALPEACSRGLECIRGIPVRDVFRACKKHLHLTQKA